MRSRRFALLLLAACGAPARTPTPVPPVASIAPIESAAPPPTAPVAPLPAATPPSTCAQTSIDLPATLPPCAAPGAKELRDVSVFALAVNVTPSSGRVKPGGSVDFTFTMTNTTKAPLHLELNDSQKPTLQVLDGHDRVIEPLEGPPPSLPNPQCAHVDCVAAPRRPSDVRVQEVTLAPGGVARMHLTWRARKLAWPRAVGPMPCCSHDDRAPLDAGPLPADNYRLAFLPPVSPNDSEQVLQHDEAQIEVAP